MVTVPLEGGGQFAELCGNCNVMGFAEKVITHGYCDRIPDRADELRTMIGSVFRMLATCALSEVELTAALRHFETDIFQIHNADFWFAKQYHRYKLEVKPQLRFKIVQPWISGRRILDFGAGDGAMARLLHSIGYQVTLSDVLDYRNTDSRGLPFVHMTEPGLVPFGDRSFDTALVLLTLHHIDAVDLPSILSGLRRTAQRIVVEEECYLLPSDLDGVRATLARDVLFGEFAAMSPSDQLGYLIFLDYFANVVVGDHCQMNLPFQFRTMYDWQLIFAREGLVVNQVLLQGFQTAYFHRSNRVWFVLDGN